MNYISKELIRTYSYSTARNSSVKERKFNGRLYTKFGELQKVTFVGNLYKVFDPSINRNKYMLMIGYAKQHPRDLSTSREEGLIIANTHAQENPSIVMEVTKNYSTDLFEEFCEFYAQLIIQRQFIKTKEELKAEKESKEQSNVNEMFALNYEKQEKNLFSF